MVKHVDVEFALIGKTRERQIAGAEKSGDGIIWVCSETEIELCVECVAEEKLYDDLASLELSREAAKAGLVFIGRRAKRELCAKLLREAALEADDRLVAHLILLRKKTVGRAQFFLSEALHADKKAALRAVTSRPFFDQPINCFPST